MVAVPMGQSPAYAQEPLPGVAPLEEQQQAPPPSDYDDQGNYDQRDQGNYDQRDYDQRNDQPAAQGQPLSNEQLDQLVAPIALYPDALVAQVLAASTYPTQVVEANRWLKAQGNIPANEIAARVDGQPWDVSVKALTAFPGVLERMDRNLQWTTDLGNAYYNQPQDVMASVQEMRHRAWEAGNLRSTPQQAVNEDGDDILIAPANPAVVYVPVYDPWAIWGYPFTPYPGFWYYPPPGIYWGGYLIGFGFGINIGWWGGWGWGWHNWGCGWRSRSVYFHRTTYFTRSTTVFNRGFSRPGSPPRVLSGTRGSFVNHGFTRTSSGTFVRSGGGGGLTRGGGGTGFTRGGGALTRGGGGYTRGSGTTGTTRGGGALTRGGGGYTRGSGTTGITRGGGGGYSRGGAAGITRGEPSGRGLGGNRPFTGSPSGTMSRPGGSGRPGFSGGGGGRPSSGGGAPAMGGGGRSGGGGGHVGGGGGGGGHGGGGGGGHGGGGGGFGGGGHGGGGRGR